jgi:spermidine synthase
MEPARRHYLSIGLLSLAVLMLEIAVSRVLSVTLFSHYAFVAISLAMFGLGLGGLLVYLFPLYFAPARLDEQVALYAMGFGLSAALGTVVYLHVRVVQEISLAGFATLSLVYAVLGVPFCCAGVCISLLMTHFSARIGRVYSADLAGASIGCLAVVFAMETAPAPQVAVGVGLLASLVALFIALRAAPALVGRVAVGFALTALTALAAWSTDLVRVKYVKGWDHFYAEYEVWNAFSRVAAFPSPLNAAQITPLREPSDNYAGPRFPRAVNLDIDGAAWTPMIESDGNLEALGFLRQSVLYVAHRLKKNGSVLIIGPGGGRDILAAKVFDQPDVLAIEINPSMRRVVQERYGGYSARPYTLPGVEVIIDEARSRLATLDRRFDVIQLSLIDTFSLNAAGGFVFSENYLYTQEAFEEYFDHLNDEGVLTITRYFSPAYPLEVLKIAAMVRAAWELEGVARPAAHVAVLSQSTATTILAKRTPFRAEEIATLEKAARDDNMDVLYPSDARDGAAETIRTLLTTENLPAYVAAHPFQIEPATDDRPFFFHFLRGRLAAGDIPDARVDPFQFLRMWQEAVLLLYLLIAVVGVLALVFFFGPLLLVRGRRDVGVGPAIAVPLLLYFACLGYGFMMIEVPLLQRFVLFLGYPVYALAVVLFALLLFSGIGSLLSGRFAAHAGRALGYLLPAIVAAALVYAFAIPPVIGALLGTLIALRIAVTVALLAPIGLLLGMAYPLGIAVLRGFGEGLVPWAWGLNGALSVAASVLAIFLGSRYGFTVAFLTGVGAYGVAAVLMALVAWRGPRAAISGGGA